MLHKHRNGNVIVCFMCKDDMHKECINNDDVLGEVVRCHCSCQPVCRAEACQKLTRVTRSHRRNTEVCSTCHLKPCMCDSFVYTPKTQTETGIYDGHRW